MKDIPTTIAAVALFLIACLLCFAGGICCYTGFRDHQWTFVLPGLVALAMAFRFFYTIFGRPRG